MFVFSDSAMTMDVKAETQKNTSPQDCAGCGKKITDRFCDDDGREGRNPEEYFTTGLCGLREEDNRQLRVGCGCRYLLKALDLFWHEDCLKCGCCDCRLGEVGSTLYTKADLILCRRDYLRLFGNTGHCAACSKVIPAFEMVMRARNNVYHLECFACQQCNHR
uniref:LIM zinc-binding domain-containing protein n=1 Tax=Timema monikensis TaxID=170555 RepID=A0A7R9EB03_9NEOP|nr:unnamed protein product [Timema monikensis]